ncbi:MAG: CHAT domain-containing protein [Streptosporangiaceae bacterium]
MPPVPWLGRDARLAALEEAQAQLTREMFALLPPDDPARELMAQFGLPGQAGPVLHIDISDLLDGEDPDGGPVTPVTAAENLLNGYEQTGELSLLNRAIGMLRATLDAGQPLDLADRHQATHVLGTALWSLFERSGDRATFDEGISLLDAAASMPGVPEAQRLKSQANLAGALGLRAERTGSRADLERSVELTRDLVERTAPADPNRPGRLCGLASALWSLALMTGESELARGAVEQQRAAIAAFEEQTRAAIRAETTGAYGPDGVPVHVFSDLGLFLAVVHQMTGEAAVLDEAVEQCQRAVRQADPWNPLYPRFQANLALVLGLRQPDRSASDDRTVAANAARAALAATPTGHPNRANRARLHAEALWQRFRQDPDPVLLDEIVQVASLAADLEVPGHRNWPVTRAVLARALGARGLRDDNAADLAWAAALLGEVAANPAVPARQRVAAAHQQTGPLLMLGDTADTLRAASLAVELLPRVAPRNLPRTDQERPLGEFHGLASHAAALAIGADKPELALTLLEHGRGILLQRALDGRADLTALREQAPGLAERFEQLRDLLDPAQPEAGEADLTAASLSQAGRDAQHRHDLAAELDELLDTIRRMPGLAGFLKPPALAELTARCTGGHVAVINLSDNLRCDALILNASGLRVVPLPELDFTEAEARADAFRANVLDSLVSAPAADQVVDTLGWLWNTITAPVLDAIGATAEPQAGAPWPRLWWVPTGPLAFLPLHAAGRYTSGALTGFTVLDRVVSSYLPTVRSLPVAVSAAVREPSALAVAMPETPGNEVRLPFASAEADDLAGRLPGTEVLKGGEATGAAVRAALSRHAWVHFACHAESSATDAAASRLLLHDHREHPLTVRDIAALRIGQTELAYLSACGTAHGPVRLADEAVHLTGTFHLAGYTHVIGTLWSIIDSYAAEIAAAVYADITTPVPDASRTAAALHRAVRQVRADRPDTPPALWAAHIHVGP